MGPGAVMVEATAVSPYARVTPFDLVLDANTPLNSYAALAKEIAAGGAVPGIQLSHAGRKGSRSRPWEGDQPIALGQGGWNLLAPSPIPFGSGYVCPDEMSEVQVLETIREFSESAQVAERAGFKIIEIHAAHGRLIHSFISPVANERKDRFGGDEQGRFLLPVLLARALRAALSETTIVAFRLSCVDWVENGIDIEMTVRLAQMLAREGVDLIDCSSGGIRRPQQKKTGPGYQVPFASRVRMAGLATAAVGEITTLEEAEAILESGSADVIMMGRKLLGDPLYLVREMASQGAADCVPPPYRRGLRTPAIKPTEHIPEL